MDKKYKRKPPIVLAFQFYVDPIPDWFMDMVSSGDAILRNCDYRKYTIDEAHCEIITSQGVKCVRGGDYIIKTENGDLCSYNLDTFKEFFEPCEDNI